MKTPRAATALAILLAVSSSSAGAFAQDQPVVPPPAPMAMPMEQAKAETDKYAKDVWNLPTTEELRKRSEIAALIRANDYAQATELLHKMMFETNAEGCWARQTLVDYTKRSEITALIRAKDYAQATELLHKMMFETGPQGRWARRTLVDCTMETGDLAAALREASLGIEAAPDDPVAQVARGIVQMARDRPDLALEDFHRAVRLAPDDAEPYLGRGTAYTARHDFRLALSDFREAERLGLCNSELLARKGMALLGVGEKEEAIGSFTEALQLDPEMADLRHFRSVCFLVVGKAAQAIDDLTSFLEIHPNQPEALFKRAYAYFLQKDYAKALRDLDRVQAIRKDDDESLVLRRIIIAAIGDGPLLKAKMAESRATDFDATMMLLARVAAVGENDQNAQIAACDDVIRDFPESVSARLCRAHLREDQNELGKARADLDAVLAKNPDLRLALISRSDVLSLLGEHELAIADAERVIRLEEDGPVGHYALAKALAAKGDAEASIAPASKAIALSRGRHFNVAYYLRSERKPGGKRVVTQEESTRYVDAGHRQPKGLRVRWVLPTLTSVTDSSQAIASPPPSWGYEGAAMFCDVEWPYRLRAESYLAVDRLQEALADAEFVVKSVERSGDAASSAFALRASIQSKMGNERAAMDDALTALSLAKTLEDAADAADVILGLAWRGPTLLLPRILAGVPTMVK